jgi:cold shock CspA family protein
VGGPAPGAGPHVGRITAFDQARGLGVLEDEDGTAFDFHATAIADGTRTIALGARVVFDVVPGHRGRYEARAIAAAPSAR